LLSVPLIAIPAVLIAAVAGALVGAILRSWGISDESVIQVPFAIGVFVGVGYAGGLFLARAPKSSSSYRRGAYVSDNDSSNDPPSDVAATRRRADTSGPNAALTVAGIAIAREDETKHFKFIGTTGTGKSTAIREVLNSALARGDRAVIADPDGGYLNTFYDARRGDVILNPFSAEAMRWNPLDEITNDYDVDQLARSLIPDNGDPDRTWTEHARAFFIAVTQQMLASGIKDDAEFYRFLIKAPVKELKILLTGTPAGPLLEEGNERMFGSVRSTASSAIRTLSYTTRQQGPSLSVRRWVREGAAAHVGGRGGVLFIPYKAGEIAALRSVISAWVRIAIFEAMDRGEGDQRLWFVVDELDALGQIDGLKDALARLRKFGGRTIIGFQSIAQVSGTYGKAAADTIVENCANTLILRCSASERGGTSEFASKLIGQREVMQVTRSVSQRDTEWFASTRTRSEQLKIEPAVMASEIERLPDLEGYLKLASVPDWKRVRLTAVNYPKRERPLSAAAGAPGASETSTSAGVSTVEKSSAAVMQANPTTVVKSAVASPPPAKRRAPTRKRAQTGTRPPRATASRADTPPVDANSTAPANGGGAGAE